MKKTKKFLPLKILLVAALVLIIVTPAFGSSPSTRVWVEFKGNRSAQVRSALKGVGAQFHYQFDHLNAFVVTVPNNELDNLIRNPHITGIEVDVDRALIEPERVTLNDIPDPYNPGQTIPFGIDAVQARDVWDADRDGVIDEGAPTGEGRTVCIIDTGYYSGHEDLEGVNDIDGYSQVVGEEYTLDGYGHGTHVAGTITAMNNNLGVVGVTPGTVSLYIVKIFDVEGNWVSKAHASDLVAAIYNCADNGADIISMSLGGFNHQPKEQAAFDYLYQKGILFVASASNDGHRTFSYPASYDSVISVGAIDSANKWADFSNFNTQVELAAPGVDVLSTVPFLDISTLTVGDDTYSGHHIEYAARGEASGEMVYGDLCDTTGDWVGKIVLCLRGDIDFSEKVTNVHDSGGVAAVIFNNEPGGFLGTMGAEGDYIVAISLSQEDGQVLVDGYMGKEGTVSSEFFWPDNGYEAWGGTSMAAPHVSGVAALVWSAYPNLTNVEIREALDATALDLGDSGRDVYYGFGLVQAYDAIEFLSGPGQGPGGPGK